MNAPIPKIEKRQPYIYGPRCAPNMLMEIAGIIAETEPSPATFKHRQIPNTIGSFVNLIRIREEEIVANTVRKMGLTSNLSRKPATKTFKIAERSTAEEPILVKVESWRPF